MTTLFQKIETDVEGWAQATWAAIKPEVVALGETVLSQIEAAAMVFVTSGGNFADALASVVGSLPADAKAGEAIIANVLSAQIATAQAARAQATTAAGSPS